MTCIHTFDIIFKVHKSKAAFTPKEQTDIDWLL